MKTLIYRSLFSILLFATSFSLKAQNNVWVDSIQYPIDVMVSDFFGACAQISNTTLTGDPLALAYFEGIGTPLNLDAGILLTTGFASTAAQSNVGSGSTGNNLGGSDPDLANLVNLSVNDATVLEFDLLADTDSLSFEYVFASEEYPEYACAGFNDVFAFFIEGPNVPLQNIALIPGTNTLVSINNLNMGVGTNGSAANCPTYTYPEYYIDTSIPPSFMEYDGYTVPLPAGVSVIPGEVYHIKIAVADVGDTAFDSAVFLSINSICDTNEVAPPAEVQVVQSGNFLAPINNSRYARSYDWDFGDGGTSNLRNPTHTYQATGNYDVRLITHNYCCSDTFNQSILVNELNAPPACYAGEDIYTCLGNNISLNAFAASDTSISYAWDYIGTQAYTTVELLTNASLYNPLFLNQNADTEFPFEFTVTDVFGNSCVDSVTIYVSDINTTGVLEDSIAFGDSLQLYTNVSGGNLPYTYLWTGPSLNNPTSANPWLHPSFSGIHNFNVQISDAIGCSVNQSFQVQVIPPISANTSNSLLCAGDQLTLPLSSSGGTGNYTYAWSGNFTDGTNQYTAADFLDDLSLENPAIIYANIPNTLDSLSFEVLITDDIGSSYTTSSYVLVSHFENNTNPQTIHIEAGEAIDLHSLIANDFSGGIAPFTYAWSPALYLDDSSSMNAMAIANQNILYILSITDAIGCNLETAPISINIIAPLECSVVGNAINFCEGEFPSLLATITSGNSSTHLWSGSFVHEGTTYEAVDILSDISSLNPSVLNFPLAYPETATLTFSTSNIYGQSCSNQIELSQSVFEDDGQIKVEEIMEGASVELYTSISGSIAPLSYVWSPIEDLTDPNIANPIASPVTNTLFNLLITDAIGCTTNDEFTVNVLPVSIHFLGDKSGIQVQIIPHPVKDVSSFQFKNLAPNESYVFSIYNALGQEVYQQLINQEELLIARKDFNSGAYFYILKNQNHQILTQGKLLFID